MTFDEQHSRRELQRALQKSEARRLLLVLIVILVVIGFTVLRHVLGGKIMQGTTYYASLGLGAGAGVYVAIFLWHVLRTEAQGRLLPTGVWVLSAVIESQIPTAALLIVHTYAQIGKLEAITTPAVILYGIFIISSILRLRPWISVLSGALSAVGHFSLFIHTYMSEYASVPSGSLGLYAAFPAYLMLSGFAAAVVSMELRKHLIAALREADAENALKLVQNELEIAKSIQQALMPSEPPQLSGFEIAGWNRPASETGGDYYDWQVMPDGRLAVVIADVTGHGLGPAMLMAVCRAYARACFPIGPELRTALARVNSHLHGDVTSGRFVTLAVALIDPKSGSVEILSAGHGPLLYLQTADGHIEEINGDGVPLGILDNEDYGEPRRIQMNPGDVLLLVTDGFTEWARPGDGIQYSSTRLGDFLRKNATLPAKSLIEALDKDVRTFGEGTIQQDDMTAVVIRCLSKSTT